MRLILMIGLAVSCWACQPAGPVQVRDVSPTIPNRSVDVADPIRWGLPASAYELVAERTRTSMVFVLPPDACGGRTGCRAKIALGPPRQE